MANKTIPARLNKYEIYSVNGARLTMLGVATVTLPSLESLSDTVTGAGVLGEVETPTVGHFGSLEMEIEWNTVTGEALRLAPGKNAEIYITSAMQVESQAGSKADKVKVFTTVRSKSLDLGSLEMGAKTGTTNTLEVVAIKVLVNGESAIELDKFNDIYRIYGEDMLRDFRL